MINKTFLVFSIISPALVFAQKKSISIEPSQTIQTIDNFGASSAWFTEFIGKYWEPTQRENMARWLFSSRLDKNGNPEGIALSTYRFNIGGGTTELGDSSKIKDFRKRAECFLNADGSYDWNKQSGYLWFVTKAKEYGVPQLIAFSNTPPVSMTQNGLGYKTVKGNTSNLKEDAYPAYAHFLTRFLNHFDSVGIHFDYVSPVNEPQWDWYNSNQEGSPWTNAEIYKVTKALDSAMTADKVKSKIFLPECANLEYLYAHSGKASEQIQHLYNTNSSLQINTLQNVYNIAGGHSYFTDGNDTFRIKVRESVRDTAAKYGTEYWETEYSMLGTNYKEGKTGKTPAIDCALFLSKVIHDDLVYGNAKAWQWWNSCEPGSPDFDTRYYLLALESYDPKFQMGKVIPTKMLWAMGNYSRFVRPGMVRVSSNVEDGLSKEAQAQNVMVSAFKSDKQLVEVVINYTNVAQSIQLNIAGSGFRKKADAYLTDKDHNLQHQAVKNWKSEFSLPARSITTIVLNK